MSLYSYIPCTIHHVSIFIQCENWKTIPAAQTIMLGTADVAQYHQIRVVAFEKTGSAAPIIILLTITEGSEMVAQLDTIMLQAGQPLTRVYDVPSKKITIVAKATTDNGSVQVFLYGNKKKVNKLKESLQKVIGSLTMTKP